MKLPTGYEIKQMTTDEFAPLWNEHAPRIFDDNSQIFRFFQHLTEGERAKAQELQSLMGSPFQLRLGLFFKNEFVGWCIGNQESAETFYMRNSAIFPEHRGKGLYRALLQATLATVTEKGFQKIYSRHTATNNAVIIPKLKAGFVITSFEVSDLFGVLIHLTYFPKDIRRKMLVYRVGDMNPDDEIKDALGLK